MSAGACCCSWGAAVGSRGKGGAEYPEFGCAKCPVHRASLGETELCKRHRQRGDLPAGISQCGLNNGWHAYMAGPCFDKLEQAVRYRDSLDAQGVTWRPQT